MAYDDQVQEMWESFQIFWSFVEPAHDLERARYMFYAGINSVFGAARKEVRADHQKAMQAEWERFCNSMTKFEPGERELAKEIFLQAHASFDIWQHEILKDEATMKARVDGMLNELSRYLRDLLNDPPPFTNYRRKPRFQPKRRKKPKPAPPPPDPEEIRRRCADLHPPDEDPRLQEGVDKSLAGMQWYLWAKEKEKTYKSKLCPHCGRRAIWEPLTEEEIRERQRTPPEQAGELLRLMAEAMLRRGEAHLPHEEFEQIFKDINFDLNDYLPPSWPRRTKPM